MPKSDSISRSFLGRVADHERKLRLELDDAERKANELVEAGRARAREILDEGQRTLTREIADIEANTDDACREVLKTALEAAKERMARRKSETADKARTAVQAVLDTVLPSAAVREDVT